MTYDLGHRTVVHSQRRRLKTREVEVICPKATEQKSSKNHRPGPSGWESMLLMAALPPAVALCAGVTASVLHKGKLRHNEHKRLVHNYPGIRPDQVHV